MSKNLDIQLQEVGAKRRFNGTLKVNTQTGRQTNIWTFRLIETFLFMYLYLHRLVKGLTVTL